MTIRVLHIFPPSLKTRFTGPAQRWRFAFNQWSNPEIVHTVLNTSAGTISDAVEAFNFTYGSVQALTPKWERMTWAVSLFKNLFKHRSQYDLLHVHVLWWGTLLLGPLLKWAKKPAIYESVLLGADNPSSIAEERFSKLKLSCLRSYAGILAISDYLAEDYLKYGFTERQVFTLANSVDTKLFSPCNSHAHKVEIRKQLGLPIDTQVLLFTGSVIHRKGVDMLFKAFIEAAETIPNLHLVVVGAKSKSENPSLDETFITELTCLLASRGLAEQVTFTGLVQDRSRLADYYRSADLFVFPSRSEGLGNVVLEAMSSGLPVIVTDLPVLSKVIRDSENGITIPVENSSALAQAINRMLTQPTLSQELANNARKFVEAHHGFTTWQQCLSEEYNSRVYKKE